MDSTVESTVESTMGRDIHLNQRLSIKGELCTVKYLGSLPCWPDDTAVGVEWDERAGKNDGEYNGDKLFDVTRRQSGSFLKLSKCRVDEKRLLSTALMYQYGDSGNVEEVKIGKKRVEIVGFDRLQAQFDVLRVVSLARMCVYELDSAIQLPKLESLDLSFNLLQSFTNVLLFIERLPSIQKLNLTGNRFDDKPCEAMCTVPLVSLNMTMTYPGDGILKSVHRCLPTLEELVLCDNAMTSVNDEIGQMPLRSLDLSMNRITQIPSVSHTVKSLNLSFNEIETLTTLLTVHHSLQALDLRHNYISHWDEIDSISTHYPRLTRLRINNNPLFASIPIEEAEFEIISRISSLERINGHDITEKERENAELWWLSQWHTSHPKWKELCAKYGRSTDNSNESSKHEDLFNVKIHHGNKTVQFKIPSSCDTLRLKSIVCRAINRSLNEFELVTDSDEPLNTETRLCSSYGWCSAQDLHVKIP